MRHVEVQYAAGDVSFFMPNRAARCRHARQAAERAVRGAEESAARRCAVRVEACLRFLAPAAARRGVTAYGEMEDI